MLSKKSSFVLGATTILTVLASHSSTSPASDSGSKTENIRKGAAIPRNKLKADNWWIKKDNNEESTSQNAVQENKIKLEAELEAIRKKNEAMRKEQPKPTPAMKSEEKMSEDEATKEEMRKSPYLRRLIIAQNKEKTAPATKQVDSSKAANAKMPEKVAPQNASITNQMVLECADVWKKEGRADDTVERMTVIFMNFSKKNDKGWSEVDCKRVAEHLLNGEPLE